MNFLRRLGIWGKDNHHPVQYLETPDADLREFDNTREYALIMDWDTAANTLPFVRQRAINLLTDTIERLERTGSSKEISDIEAQINKHTNNMYSFRGSDENLLAVAEYLTSGDNIVNSYYTQPVTIGPRTLAFSMDRKTPRLVENPFRDEFNVVYVVIPQGAVVNGKTFGKPVVRKLKIPTASEIGGVNQDFAGMLREYGYGEDELTTAYNHLTGN